MNSIPQDLAGPARADGRDVRPADAPPAPRRPYDKPEVISDATPLLALLTSQCNGTDTPNEG